MRTPAVLLLLSVLAAPPLVAQAKRAGTVVEPATITCPQVLGDGVQTKRRFCDVPIGRSAADGIVVALPPHTGDVILRFDLHNRHTYSEELTKSGRGFRRYTAGIGVMAPDDTLLSRAVVHSEFRTARDLFDRIAGGAGVSGVKAVAPTGVESVSITIPASERGDTVSIVGEKLTEERLESVDTFTATGRPAAVISNVTLEYRPAPARRR